MKIKISDFYKEKGYSVVYIKEPRRVALRTPEETKRLDTPSGVSNLFLFITPFRS
jgi:hypothetical protein